MQHSEITQSAEGPSTVCYNHTRAQEILIPTVLIVNHSDYNKTRERLICIPIHNRNTTDETGGTIKNFIRHSEITQVCSLVTITHVYPEIFNTKVLIVNHVGDKCRIL